MKIIAIKHDLFLLSLLRRFNRLYFKLSFLRYFISIFLTVTLICTVVGQNNPHHTISTTSGNPDIVFNHLTEKDGLSFNIVTGIVQDNEGMLWISTAFGLNRYDGQRFDIFKRNKKDPKSIIQNNISSLCKDLEGNIWGTTEDGIFCYDQKNKYFKSYKSADSLIYPSTHSIVCDAKGQIWAGSRYGLVKIDTNNSVYHYISSKSDDASTISNNEISKSGIISDANGNGLWISTGNGLNYNCSSSS